MKGKERVTKDPGMVQRLMKGWKGAQDNVSVGHTISLPHSVSLEKIPETEKDLRIALLCR